jgi:hypothetical protein
MRPGRHWLLLLSALLLACGPEAPPSDTAPLVDERHAALVLTESAVLDMPPAYSANRFLSGWWPNRRGGSLRQANVGDRVLLEAVFLDGRERRLSTRLEIVEAEPGATFGVRVAGVELPSQPLAPNAEIPLPGGLPLGRLPIELDLRGARVIVAAAGFGHAWQPGEVALAAEAIVQGGYSAIDFPRRLARPATLVGRFAPPPEPESDQRFAVLVETGAGDSEVAYEWLPGGRGEPRGSQLRLPLPAGFVRIRLLAQGLGAAGRWLDLGIAGGDARPARGDARMSTAEGRAGTIYMAASERYKLIRAPDLGLATDTTTSRDAEYLYDLLEDPAESRNLAGTRAIEADWLRARLEAWIERGATP